jgi:hypothetical protein
LLYAQSGILLELFGSQKSKHNALAVDNDCGVPAHAADSLTDVTQPFIELGGGHILARNVSGTRVLGVGSLNRKPGGHPIQLACHVVVHVAEP